MCLLGKTPSAPSVSEFETSINEEIAEAGTKLLATLQTTSISDQDAALQSFLFALFNQKRCRDANKYTFVAFSFLVLYSFSEDGTLKPCNVFSQYFSKVVFFARATIFNQIMEEVKRENKGFFE